MDRVVDLQGRWHWGKNGGIMIDLVEGATDIVAINLEVLIEVSFEMSTLEENLCGYC